MHPIARMTPEVTFSIQKVYRTVYRTCVSRLPPVSHRYKYCTGTGTVQYANVGVWYR